MKTMDIKEEGFTLIEILVVITVFAVLGILISRSIILSLGGVKKSESVVSVKENLNYSENIIIRQLRSANSIVDCGSTSNASSISYIDQGGDTTSFSCIDVGTSAGYIASGSAALTSTSVNVTSCSFSCTAGDAGSPDVVSMSFAGTDATTSDAKGATVTISSQVSLRNY